MTSNTIRKYRSDMWRLWLSSQTGRQRERALQKIAYYERVTGRKADPSRGFQTIE
jgi:hypothetical protein